MKNRKTLFLTLLAVISSILLLAQFTVSAAPTVITDTTATSATNDGTINVDEYIGCTAGVSTGFGDVIGATGQLCIDSSETGALNLGLIVGAGDLNDSVVIYIDSVEGGFGSTTNFTDEGDGLRKAISGKDTGTDPIRSSVLTFATGFTADYAIAFSQDFGGLWQLAENGSHTFIDSVSLTPTGTNTSAAYELNLTLEDIGVSQGGTFTYVATYLAQSAYRSNEFQGAAGPFDGPENGDNYGWNPVTLAAGDFNTFISFLGDPEQTATAGGATLTPTDVPATATATATEPPLETATPTATATDVLVETATATEVVGVDLLVNGGFEAVDAESKPDLTPWVLKNGVGEKVKCNKEAKVFAHTGICAFRFKGGVGENSKIQQNIDLDGLIFAVGDALDLSLFVNASNAATAAKVKVTVKFDDATEAGKINEAITSTAGYVEILGGYDLLSANVSKIKVQVGNKSAAGKLYVDTMTLNYTMAGGGALIPLP
ncbi:MAG: hypothetical protein H7X77_03880 [Anaerolineae bacterium]|nr:hypothetical protein [Anaerolineae bacterium]